MNFLWIRCTFASKAARDRIHDWLAEETRPDFEDEVEERWREAFLAIEDVDFPSHMAKEGDDQLWLYFVLDGGDAVWLTLAALKDAGAKTVYGYDMDDDTAISGFMQVVRGRVKTLLEENGDDDKLVPSEELAKQLARLNNGKEKLVYLIDAVEKGQLT